MTTVDKAKNVAQKSRGKAKETTGKLTGNKRVERAGKIDQVKGNAKQTGEKMKDLSKK